MSKVKQLSRGFIIQQPSNTHFSRVAEVKVSERKLNPQITIGFAKKAPKFVVKGRHVIVYEK